MTPIQKTNRLKERKKKEIKKIDLNYPWDLKFKSYRSSTEQESFNMDITDKINEIIDRLNTL